MEIEEGNTKKKKIMRGKGSKFAHELLSYLQIYLNYAHMWQIPKNVGENNNLQAENAKKDVNCCLPHGQQELAFKSFQMIRAFN